MQEGHFNRTRHVPALGDHATDPSSSAFSSEIGAATSKELSILSVAAVQDGPLDYRPSAFTMRRQTGIREGHPTGLVWP